MKRPFSYHPTMNQLLAGGALLLGALAVFGSPYRGPVARVNLRELARDVGVEADHVTAEQLADWILQQRADYRLLDLRDEAAWSEYHIPGAELVPMAKLIDYPLLRNETIVLYSDGGIHAAQGWFLLEAAGHKSVALLLGGLNAWKDEILFPVLAEDASAEQRAAFERARFVSEHFGGTPSVSGGTLETDRTPTPLPKTDMPVAPATPRARKRKAKEGC
ncbi:MAG: rhodanese-like domain-containing protein [Acidobacteriota bacterium]|nr:MAG: rhodanese-like domain-containing protein [Acidobacteriota bacterium]